MTGQVREKVTATRSHMYWGQKVSTYCAHFLHTTKLMFSKHLLAAKWIYDRSLFSQTLHIRCAHLRVWRYGYPRSGCNFHSRLCVCMRGRGDGMWQCLKLGVWCFNLGGIAWIKTKSHSNLPPADSNIPTYWATLPSTLPSNLSRPMWSWLSVVSFCLEFSTWHIPVLPVAVTPPCILVTFE